MTFKVRLMFSERVAFSFSADRRFSAFIRPSTSL